MVQGLRAAVYARVSSEEQVEGYSLDAQRRAFRTLVEGRGWTVFQEYLEEGRSAHTDDIRKRPVFKQAIDDALAGRYDVLVVHKIDRFSRKLRVTLEYFEKLGKAGVGFVSIQNEIDYSTPTGKFMLVMQGGLAELYSDNLSQEVKKGLHERRAQGLYCGLLPFGARKDEDGIPSPDPDTSPGLKMAFDLAAVGKSDREVARALNAAGYRTAGNQGNRLFSKDTVRGILTNRFYLGEIPDGNGGWIQARHEPLVPDNLFEAARASRERNRHNPSKTTRADARLSSLSGLARCWECGATHRTLRQREVARMVCNTKLKRGGCSQKSARLDRYEAQLQDYMSAFRIPEDYHEKLLDAHKSLTSAYDDTDHQRKQLMATLERLKDLYKWGDKTRREYMAESNEIEQALRSLPRTDHDEETITRLAEFLGDVASAWREATQKNRNKLAKALFESVWVKDQSVLGVTPRAELKPFFDLQYSELSTDVLQWRPRPDSNRRSLP